ncbi:class I SAM-dependent methyltransferase [Nitrospirillum viridazoti]|uniref:Methyltransferase type 11 n=1 Tax=Nitrospirillum viridazoti CBAmc TaxID=1441467 RepID=A0A248JZH2_9PROT|nr:methyltransferase domain-containing protein [Nitrospirillum amazonense]ASG23959.1 methyltransferase type 11 [Nitrospirillum amazonense CBAmc]TWB44605.1 methyltransferase family protein [Nitrospirillum amazonense]
MDAFNQLARPPVRFRAAWHALGSQLRHPTGVLGHLLGLVMNRLNARPNRVAVEALAPRPGDTVLELGCGPGQALALAVKAVGPTGTVHGIDQSAVMLQQAAKLNRQSRQQGQLHLHLGRFDTLPLPAGAVDGMLAVNVAYFWQNAADVLRETRRVLRPGGRLVVYVTDAATMQRWPFAGTGTHRLFTPLDLRAMLLAGGFPGDKISIRSVRLGYGMTGLVAIAENQPCRPLR